MSIGIYDGDMARYIPLVFNLECMKFASYYKKKNQIVVMAPDFSPNRNTQFIYRKDYDDGFFPQDLHKLTNVNYGGLAFTNNHYSPLPLEVEAQYPDASIYDRFLKQFKEAGPQAVNLYHSQMRAEHCRLSLDGKTIWPDFTKQIRPEKKAVSVFFHDYNLGAIEGSFETVRQVLQDCRRKNSDARLGLKFPIQIKDPKELIKWSELDLSSSFYGIIFHGLLPDDIVNDWILAQRQRTAFLQMKYHITGSWATEQELIDKLPMLFNQLVILRSYRAFCRLVYEEDFFSDPRWNDVLRLFNFYLNSFSHKKLSERWTDCETFSLFDYVKILPEVDKYHSGVIIKDEARRIFSFVREKNYPLFQMFYETTAETLGGKL